VNKRRLPKSTSSPEIRQLHNGNGKKKGEEDAEKSRRNTKTREWGGETAAPPVRKKRGSRERGQLRRARGGLKRKKDEADQPDHEGGENIQKSLVKRWNRDRSTSASVIVEKKCGGVGHSKNRASRGRRPLWGAKKNTSFFHGPVGTLPGREEKVETSRKLISGNPRDIPEASKNGTRLCGSGGKPGIVGKAIAMGKKKPLHRQSRHIRTFKTCVFPFFSKKHLAIQVEEPQLSYPEKGETN